MTRTARSVRSEVLASLIGVAGWKKRFSSAELTRARITELSVRPVPFGPPARLEQTVRIDAGRRDGWPVYTLSSLAGPVTGDAVYAHGGAWMNEITGPHWRLIAELVARTGVRFTVPIYPLVPFGTADVVVPVFADLLAEAVMRSGSDQTSAMGDSAGGTIALAAAQLLRDRAVAGPGRIVLISPALDLAFTDPLLQRIQTTDPWLAVPGLGAAAELWRGERSIRDPLVSPIHGSLSGLGRVTVFSGTHDILNADAVRLVARARAEQHPLDFHQQPNMLHVYPLLPIPEGRVARNAIVDLLSGAHA